MNNHLWIATFPKSGTTWLRFLVYNMFWGSPSSSVDVDERVPSIHGENDNWKLVLDKGGIIQTHKAFYSHYDKYGVPNSFIYVVRHPGDVLLSHANYFVLTQLDSEMKKRGLETPTSQLVNELANAYFKVYLNQGSVPKHIKMGFGSWQDNVKTWLAARALTIGDEPVSSIVLRYEDLISNPVHQMARLAAFLNMDISRESLEKSVYESSFSSMKRMQEREISEQITGRFYQPRHQKAYDAGLRFVNAGKSGRCEDLPEAVKDRLQVLFGETMEMLGYSMFEPVRPMPTDIAQIKPISADFMKRIKE